MRVVDVMRAELIYSKNYKKIGVFTPDKLIYIYLEHIKCLFWLIDEKGNKFPEPLDIVAVNWKLFPQDSVNILHLGKLNSANYILR